MKGDDARPRPDPCRPSRPGGCAAGRRPPGRALPHGRQGACLVLCDHAGRRVPQHLDHLGLPEHELRRHIGWDIGAADVTRALAVLLDAPALLCHVSRLVIDSNRRPGRADSIPEVSDGTPVPGNKGVDAAEARRRLAHYFIPYHRAVSQQIARLRRAGVPAIVSIHSFTPILQRGWRPWQVAVLWDEDDRLAAPVLAGLRRDRSPSGRRQRALFRPLSGRLHDPVPRQAAGPAARDLRAAPGPDRHACRVLAPGPSVSPPSCAGRSAILPCITSGSAERPCRFRPHRSRSASRRSISWSTRRAATSSQHLRRASWRAAASAWASA